MTSSANAVARARDQIQEEYRRRTPKSAALFAQGCQYLAGGETRTATFFPPYPVYIERGAGPTMVDADGNSYLDVLNNYTSLVHGHAHPAIVEAIARQAGQGTAFAAPTQEQAALAEALCKRVASIERVRFCNSGTEATMFAIRAAKAFTGRRKILKMEGGYHGTHEAAEYSIAPPLPQAGLRTAPATVPASLGLFDGVASDVLIAPYNDEQAAVSIIEAAGADLAVVIVEPVMGSISMVPATEAYLRTLQDAAHRVGALLILDEVITFRLAFGGAQQFCGVTPDLTTLGKLIGGGLPVGALGGRSDVMALFDARTAKLAQSGTFNGNSLTMAAGLAALKELTAEEIARINALGDRLRSGFAAALDEAKVIGHVSGFGSLAGYHFGREAVTDYRSAAECDRFALGLVHLALLNRGVFAAPRGFMCVSTAMTGEDVETVVAAFREVLHELKNFGCLPDR